MKKIYFENNKQETAYFKQNVIKIDNSDLRKLISFARNKKNKLKKSRFCCHNHIKDKVHEMIIYHEKNYYVRPHKHPGRSESAHIIKGKVDILIFNDEGKILEIVKLGDKTTKSTFFYRLNCDYYHMFIIKSRYLIFHETSLGPFKRNNIKFAKWSPLNMTKLFQKSISQKIKNYENLHKKK